MSEKPISPLRRRMVEDMTVRNFAEKTRNDYIRHVRTFTAFLGRRIRPRLRISAFSSCIRRRPGWVRRASMARLWRCVSVTLDRPEMARHLTFVRERLRANGTVDRIYGRYGIVLQSPR